jgi:E3 ubiquitin-protein ligase synoviolin
MQAQLQEISNRIQQEMYALQTTQAELATLHALTVELNRLRQIPPQVPHGPIGPFSQAGVNNQFATQQPSFPFSNTSLYTPPPAATRHGGAPYASAIPSGSQDLPEGVIIPPGWSLLPLQRLDEHPLQQQTGAQPTLTASSHGTQHQQHQAAAPFSRNSIMHNPNGATGFSTPSANTHATVRNGDTQSGINRIPESSSSRAQREALHVAAPTPVIPQWGGTSQLLFDNRGGSSTTSVAGNSNLRSENTTGTGSHAADSSDSDGEESDRDSGKGKAKAVTIEDVEEDESD